MLKTPTQLTAPIQDGSSSVNNEIKVKTAYNGEVMITYIDENITYEKLCQEIRGICRFSPDQPFTMKWVDDENDPCTISTQMELDEAIRLYELNKDSELVIHEPTHPLVQARLLFRPNLDVTQETELTYNGNITNFTELYNWINSNCLPLVKQLNGKSDLNILSNKKPVLIFIYKRPQLVKKYLEIVNREFVNVKNELNFFYCSKYSICGAILKYFKRYDANLPIVLLDTLTELYIYNNIKIYKHNDLIKLYIKSKLNEVNDPAFEGPFKSLFINALPSNEKYTLELQRNLN